MANVRSVPKLILISFLSVSLTALTGVLGAPLARVLRKSFGRNIFWLIGVSATASLVVAKAFPLSVLVASVWMTLGVYAELEQKGRNWWLTSSLSILCGIITAFLGALAVMSSKGLEPWVVLTKTAEEFAAQLEKVNPQVKIDAQLLVQQAPSAIVIMVLLTLGLGLIFERRAFRWFQLPNEKTSSQLKLLDYRVPDIFIWITMSSFLLTMASGGWKVIAIVAMNVVNVSVVLYFFQGIAVIETLLVSIRAGFFTRALTYFLMIGQMLVLVSALGFFDYWLDLRQRLRNWKQKSGEGF